MSRSTERHVDDRIRWVRDRPLRSVDLTGQASEAARARGAHVLRAHGTWGVLAGFAVALGQSGLVTVGRGVAYDACGREIVLPGRTLTMPQGSALRDGSALVVHRQGAAWRAPGALRNGLDVPLAHLRVEGTDVWLDHAGRRRCATQRRPVELYAGRQVTARADWLAAAGGLSCLVETGITTLSPLHWFAALEAGATDLTAGLLVSLVENANRITVVVIPTSAAAVALLAGPFLSTPPAIAWTAIGARDDRP
jgi:hypothetical protein